METTCFNSSYINIYIRSDLLSFVTNIGEQQQKKQYNNNNNNNRNLDYKNMATADRLDINVGGGLKGVKEIMASLKERIKETNARSLVMEEEKDIAKKKYIKLYGQQQALKDRKLMMEERLEKSEEKLKEITKRFNEKVWLFHSTCLSERVNFYQQG